MTSDSCSYILYFDDHCPLCRRTVRYIQAYIRPKQTVYQAISTSNLSYEERHIALSEMLLVASNGDQYLGYTTYLKLLKISYSKLSLIYRLASLIFGLPVISFVGQRIYMKIASSRMRCSIDDGECKAQ